MFFFKIADLIFQVENHYDFTRQICRDYLVSPADFSKAKTELHPDVIHISIQDIQAQLDRAVNLGRRQYPLWYYEPVALHRAVCQLLPLYQAFFLHCALLDVKGKGIALAAGVHGGKSTQARLWQKAFPGDTVLINGDKPVFRLIQDTWVGYGTPWEGKEAAGCPGQVPLKAVFFLRKSEIDASRRLKPEEILERIFYHMELPRTKPCITRMADLLADFIAMVPCYELSCSKTVNAALTAMGSL